MRKVVRKSSYKLYRITPQGLVYKGTFPCEYTEEVAPRCRTRVRAMTEQLLERRNAARCAMEDSFEQLVDSAAE